MSLRSDLKDHLAAGLPEPVSVYSVGADLVAVPAVVIQPADPYMIPTTMGAASSNQVALNLIFVVPRSDPESALSALEDLRYQVTTLVKTFAPPAGRWTAFGGWDTISIGDVEHATGTLECLFVDGTDRGATVP